MCNISIDTNKDLLLNSEVKQGKLWIRFKFKLYLKKHFDFLCYDTFSVWFCLMSDMVAVFHAQHCF